MRHIKGKQLQEGAILCLSIAFIVIGSVAVVTGRLLPTCLMVITWACMMVCTIVFGQQELKELEDINAN